MSRLQKPTHEDNAKITNEIITESLKSALQASPTNLYVRNDKNKASSSKVTNKCAKPSNSDGNIIKSPENIGFKQKLVNKVKSWNNKDAKVDSHTSKTEAALIQDIEALNLSNSNSEDNLCKPDWLRARDSLENLLSPKTEKTNKCSEINSRSMSLPNASQDKLNSDSPSTSNSVSKVLTWDPWDKVGRKNKKENKRRKLEKSPLHSRDNSRQRVPDIESSRKGHMSGDEVRPKLEETPTESNDDVDQEEISYEYKPYHTPSAKSVDFTNEVMVVYFTGDEVINECTEPLKKELEQQVRNKEMRKGHLPAMLVGKKHLSENYMAAWMKK